MAISQKTAKQVVGKIDELCQQIEDPTAQKLVRLAITTLFEKLLAVEGSKSFGDSIKLIHDHLLQTQQE